MKYSELEKLLKQAGCYALKEGAVRKRSVIANQRARWCGTPRVFPSGTIPRIFKHLGRKTKLFPSNRGAATPVTSVTGSQRHTFLTAPSTGQKFPVGRHRTEDVPMGTLKSIKRAAGIQ